MVISVRILFLAIVLDGVDAHQVGVRQGIAPNHLHVVAAFLHLVFPGRFQFAGSAFHGQEGNLIQFSVNPYLDFGHIRVVLFGQGEDLAAHVLLGHARGVIGRNAPQAHQVAPDDKAVAGEVKLIDVGHPVVLLVPHQGIGVHEVLLQGKHFRPGHGNGDVVLGDASAVLGDELERVVEGVLATLGQGHVGAFEIQVPDFHHRVFPEGRHVLQAQHYTQNTTHSGRVAVGILSAAGGDFQGFAKVAAAVKQTHCHIGTVQFCVDVKAQAYALGAASVKAPFLEHLEPAVFPVGILLVPHAHVVEALPEGALLRNGLQGHVHDAGRVILHESGTIQAGNESSAIETVSAVHDMTYTRGDIQGFRNHARSHQAHEIGLDLEVQVVGVRIVDPVAGCGRHDALAHIVPACLIGVGQVVRCVGKTQGQLLGRGVQPQLFEGFGKGEVVVNVVKQAGFAVPPVLHIAFSPADGNLFGDDGAAELEFRGGAIHHADGLTSPAAHNLVHKGILGQGHRLRCLGSGAGCEQRHQQYAKAIALHKLPVQ